MKSNVERRTTQSLLVVAATLVLCGPPQVAVSAEASLALWLTAGHDSIYVLNDIERVSFDNDTLQIVMIDRTDSYAVESIQRIDFVLDELAGVDTPEYAPGLLKAVYLFQNQPNPFFPETRIEFELPQEGRAELRIYAANGRLIRTLLDERRPAGRHNVRWDGCDEGGRTVASGVYFYSLTAPGVDESRKMLLVK